MLIPRLKLLPPPPLHPPPPFPMPMFQVGSRRVVQVAGILMIALGCLGKFGALFVTIPEPVIGGMFIIMFGRYACRTGVETFVATL